MTDKAYIVANEQQECEVLKKLSDKGIMWSVQDDRGIYWSPVHKYTEYPYGLNYDGEQLNWFSIDHTTNEEIVYDGRKESKMKINREVYDTLVEWRDNHELQTTFISGSDLFHFPHKIVEWVKDTNTLFDNRNRLITILQWLNNKDVFEIEKPKKWVVRSKETDEDGDYHYVDLDNFKNLKSVSTIYGLDFATKFDAKEEAQSWANSHQEVVEVVDV